MQTYEKSVRSVMYHLTTLMPSENKASSKMSSFRLPEDMLKRLSWEAETRRWSKTDIVEQALLWYFELCHVGRAILSQPEDPLP